MNLKNIIIVFLFVLMVAQLASAQSNYNKLDKLRTNDLVTEKFDVQSVTNGSKPCPAMTQIQRDAIVSPIEGQCIYNSLAKTLNLYNGTAWVEVSGGGGEGGIAKWVTDKLYEVDDVVIEGNEIYSCVEEHVSGVSFDGTKFQILAKDLTSSTGVLSMSNGGTNKALTPQLGGVVYTDAGSMEVLPFGVLGKFLKSNGEAAPSWEDVPSTEVNDASFSGVLSLAKGGTNKELVANNGAIAYSSATSLELLAPGSAGQVLQSNGVGAPSFNNQAVKAKSQSGSVVTLEEIQVPSNQLTQTDTNKHLIETGNGNLLINPGFEHSTVSTGWSESSTGTALTNLFAEDVLPLDGKFSGSFTCIGGASGGTCTLFQDVVTKHAFQGMVQAKIKSNSATGVKLFSRVDGVNSISKDITSIEAGIVPIPQPLGTTSTGIALEITVAASETKTVLLDSAFVGAQDVKQDVSACNSIECETEFSGVIQGFTATGAFTAPNIEGWAASGSRPSTGNYTLSIPLGVFSVVPNCTGTVINPTTNASRVVVFDKSGSTTTNLLFQTTTNGGTAAALNNLDFTIACQRSGSDFTNAKLLAGGSIYSTASDSFSTDTNTLTFKPTTAITAADPIGTYNTFSYAANTNTKTICTAAPSTLPTKADGFRIFTRAFNVPSTCGNPARVEMKIAQAGTSLPTVKTDLYKNTSKSISGGLDFSNVGSESFGAWAAGLYEQSTGVIVIDAGRQLATNTVASFLLSDTTTAASGYLVINAQKMKDAIVGDFTNIEKCADDYECTDTFSAKVSAAGVVSGENIDWIDGNATISDTSSYLLNFNASVFTESPACVAQAFQGGDVAQITASASIASPSSVSVRTGYQASGTGHVKQPYEFRIICQKAGADYKPKTAKIANPEALDYVHVDAVGWTGSSAITANVTDIPFNQIENTDTDNAWNGSVFNVPKGGIYIFSGTVFTSTTVGRIEMFINGISFKGASTASSVNIRKFEVIQALSSGQQVSFRFDSNNTLAGPDNRFHYITITRIPGQF